MFSFPIETLIDQLSEKSEQPLGLELNPGQAKSFEYITYMKVETH